MIGRAAQFIGEMESSDSMHSFISFRTGQYKLHYYETPTSIKFVMLTDTQTLNMRNVLHQIYVNLYVEFGEFCFGCTRSFN
jgi:hypothetical protein